MSQYASGGGRGAGSGWAACGAAEGQEGAPSRAGLPARWPLAPSRRKPAQTPPDTEAWAAGERGAALRLGPPGVFGLGSAGLEGLAVMRGVGWGHQSTSRLTVRLGTPPPPLISRSLLSQGSVFSSPSLLTTEGV